MSNKVDKLFREKLEAHTIQPSAQAWEKIETHLAKKNKMVTWFRVAAAIALLGIVGFATLVWNIGDTTSTQIVKTEQKKETTPQVIEQPRREQPNVEQQPVARTAVKQKRQNSIQQNVTQTQAQEEKPEVFVPEEPVEQKLAMNEATVATPATSNAEKGMVITYSLPAIRKAQPEITVAEAAKKTGLERVLEIAKDVKNSDNALADLREAKDEIFAFDFKREKDKTKKQNY